MLIISYWINVVENTVFHYHKVFQTECIKHVFLFWHFNIWGLTDPGGTAPSKARQFLELGQVSSPACRTHRSPYDTQPPLPGSHTQSHYQPALATLEPKRKTNIILKIQGLPWWSSGWESVWWCRGLRLHPGVQEDPTCCKAIKPMHLNY